MTSNMFYLLHLCSYIIKQKNSLNILKKKEFHNKKKKKKNLVFKGIYKKKEFPNKKKEFPIKKKNFLIKKKEFTHCFSKKKE